MDDRVRELERRFLASRSLDDELELLRYRLRVGATTEVRLAFCAELGHAAARLAVEYSPPAGEQCGLGYLDGVLKLSSGWRRRFEADEPLLVRIAIALASWASSRCPGVTRRNEVLAALARHAVEPDDATLEQVAVVSHGLPRASPRARPLYPEGTPEQHAAASLFWAADAVLVQADPETGRGKAVDRTAACALSCELLLLGRDSPEAWPRTQERLRGAVLEQVGPWALGHGDPLVRLANRARA